jgi:Tfp pilus assembly protein PilO
VSAKSNGRRFSFSALPANQQLLLGGVVVALILVLYLVLYYFPAKGESDLKEMQVAQIPVLRQEIAMLESELETEKKNLEQARDRYRELTGLFHTQQELEGLYRDISTIALRNGLTITSLNKGEQSAVYQAAPLNINSEIGLDPSMQSQVASPVDPMENLGEENLPVAYYKIPMSIEMIGGYPRYVLFRKSLAEMKKLVNIDEEKVVVLDDEDSPGKIKVSATLSTYRLPSAAGVNP